MNIVYSVVIIPGLGTKPPSQWEDSSGRWLEALVDGCGARAQTWVYQSAEANYSGTTVQHLADEGKYL
ncbi:hypothetical protein, partial [Staphylococcus aureus]